MLQWEPWHRILFFPCFLGIEGKIGTTPELLEMVRKRSYAPSKEKANHTIIPSAYLYSKCFPRIQEKNNNNEMFPEMQTRKQESFSENCLYRCNCRNVSLDWT